jgi:hypothetical protein
MLHAHALDVNAELEESFLSRVPAGGRQACTDKIVPKSIVADRPTVGANVTRVCAAVS